MGETPGYSRRRGWAGHHPPDDAHDLLTGKWDSACDSPQLTMHDTTQASAEMSHIDKIRSNYNTTDLGAIMARFYTAVSWRED